MERKKLLSILNKLKPGISSKNIVESMQYFFFSGKELVTYNDQISIQHPLKTDFSLFVKATDLYKIMSRTTAEEIKMEQKGEKLNIKTKGINVNLTTLLDPEITKRVKKIKKSLKKVKWMPLPENFTECVNLCAFAAAKANSEFTLSCIKLSGKECIASDNDRIAVSTLSKSMEELFLTASEIPHLTAIDPTKYAVSKGWVHFKNEDGCVFSIKKVNGSFPDFAPLIDFDGTKVDLPKEMLEGADLASIFVDALSPLVTISIADKACTISISSESGSVKYTSKIKYKGKKIKFTINPDFLKEMMNHSTSLIISKSKAKLVTENFTLVTLLYLG